MSCQMFEVRVVSDDAEERRWAEEHAVDCARCRAVLEGHLLVRDRVADWARQTEAPPELEARVRRSFRAAVRTPAVASAPPAGARSQRRRSPLWIALAASFLLGIGLVFFQLPGNAEAPSQTKRLLDADALEIAKMEEAAKQREISELERRAAPILQRATDTGLASHRAAWLMETRTRIATLDGTIADVEDFVARNPGHARARTMLLDAYREKQEVLREVIAREERSS